MRDYWLSWRLHWGTWHSIGGVLLQSRMCKIRLGSEWLQLCPYCTRSKMIQERVYYQYTAHTSIVASWFENLSLPVSFCSMPTIVISSCCDSAKMRWIMTHLHDLQGYGEHALIDQRTSSFLEGSERPDLNNAPRWCSSRSRVDLSLFWITFPSSNIDSILNCRQNL